ncbi:MAG TPA: hypothetical protein ENK23_08780 [Sorangium sp.]|nr:hypothetical protein [Sorangium sp.]
MMSLVSVSWAPSVWAQSQSRRAASRRPYDAPLLSLADLPPDPPEYLKYNAAGVRFSYHPSVRDQVRQLIAEVEPVRGELSQQLGKAVLSRVRVRVATGSEDYNSVLPPDAPRSISMVALSPSNASQQALLVMRLGAPGTESSSETRATFRRGMAYLGLDEATHVGHMPVWFRTGYAVAFSHQAEFQRARTLWWSSLRWRHIPVPALDMHMQGAVQMDSLAVAEASAFVQYLLQGDRAADFVTMVNANATGASFEQGLQRAYQGDLAALAHAWRPRTNKDYVFMPMLLGGTLLWVAAMLAARLRQRRGLQTLLAAAAKEEDDDEEEEKAPTPPAATRTDAGLSNIRIVRFRGRLIRLPDEVAEVGDCEQVPKISHNGRWHTLH